MMFEDMDYLVGDDTSYFGDSKNDIHCYEYKFNRGLVK